MASFSERINVNLQGAKYCKIHKFITYSDIEFSNHLQQFKHYAVGGEATCENCKESIPAHLIPVHTLGTPFYILCDNCKQKLNYGLDTIGYKQGDDLTKFKK